MVEEAEGKREDHSEDIFDGIQVRRVGSNQMLGLVGSKRHGPTIKHDV